MHSTSDRAPLCNMGGGCAHSIKCNSQGHCEYPLRASEGGKARHPAVQDWLNGNGSARNVIDQLERELAEKQRLLDAYEERDMQQSMCVLIPVDEYERLKSLPSATGEPVAWMILHKGCQVGLTENDEETALCKARNQGAEEVVPLYRSAPVPVVPLTEEQWAAQMFKADDPDRYSQGYNAGVAKIRSLLAPTSTRTAQEEKCFRYTKSIVDDRCANCGESKASHGDSHT